jgi:TetR/AcrR family transcriptional regulator
VKTTTERILDAAEHEFATNGYDAASLSLIAAHVQIRVPSLYKHFANKRDLYLAVAQRLLDPYVVLLDRALQVPTDAATAEHNLLAVASHYLETPNLARLVQHAALAGGEPLELLVTRWHGPLFRRATELTRGPGGPLALVIAFHSMMSGYVTMAGLHARLIGADPLGPRAIAAQLALMRGLVGALWASGPTPPAPRASAGTRRGSSTRGRPRAPRPRSR